MQEELQFVWLATHKLYIAASEWLQHSSRFLGSPVVPVSAEELQPGVCCSLHTGSSVVQGKSSTP